VLLALLLLVPPVAVMIVWVIYECLEIRYLYSSAIFQVLYYRIKSYRVLSNIC